MSPQVFAGRPQTHDAQRFSTETVFLTEISFANEGSCRSLPAITLGVI